MSIDDNHHNDKDTDRANINNDKNNSVTKTLKNHMKTLSSNGQKKNCDGNKETLFF